MNGAREKFEWLLQRVWFRIIFAAMLVAMHVGDVKSFALERFHQPFNREPNLAPAFLDPIHETHAAGAKRLVVSRWDGEHYIALALRGYSACPTGPMTDNAIRARDGTCTLTFYPGYPLIGRVVAHALDLPMDYALWYVSLLASLVTFFLWTSRTMTNRFGLTATWFALIAFNAYGPSCYLVFVGTEACAVAFTFASYYSFARKWFVASAFFAGAASAMRISGVAASMAVCCALLVETIVRPPRGAFAWITRALCVPLSGWGALLVMRFFYERFDDPMIYARAHKLIYNHSASLKNLLDPDPGWIMHGLDNPMHDGMWVIGLVFWFLLGYRALFKKLPSPERLFMIVLVAVTLGVSIYGSLDIYLLGLSRYALLAFPLFLAIGVYLRNRPLVLLVWLVLCRWHYREADLCYYVGDVGIDALKKCNMTQWINW